MSKLKDIPFGSEIPTFDNDGYIALSSGLKGPSGSAIIETYSGLAFFIGEACYASYAHCADSANEACCAENASYACYACEASYAHSADSASEAGDALYLSYCGSHLSPSYCDSLSAYLLV